MGLQEELRQLYLETSKHSNYQILPQEIADLLKLDKKDIVSRYEKERFKFISENIELKGKRVLDIGGNTGYFTFESIKKGCRHADYFEGNKLHAEFVEKAKVLFEAGEHVTVFSDYYLFEGNKKKYDVAYCLNVVHHLGDDFLNAKGIEQAKEKMLGCINQLSYVTDYMVFQMGFNWCGDKNQCLFANGTKEELERFLQEGTKNYWNVIKIGIAERKNGTIEYKEMNSDNNRRVDEMGEFLNRPIFIMKAKNDTWRN